MSIKCRICSSKLPDGRNRLCLKCKKDGFLETWDPEYSYVEEKKWLDFCKGIVKYHRETGLYS